MNLLYLFGSLAGVALLVLLCAALFGTKNARIAGPRNLEAYVAQISPGFRARSMALGADAKAALAENDVDGTIHLVVACGDGLVSRKLTPELLKAITRNGAVLSLRLSDFTLPHADIVFTDPAAAMLWEKKLWAQ